MFFLGLNDVCTVVPNDVAISDVQNDFAISRAQELVDSWIGGSRVRDCHENVCGFLFHFGTGVLRPFSWTWLSVAFSIPR